MAFRQKLRESPHYQSAEDVAEQAQEAATAAEAVAPVVQLEKTDVQMWADVFTVVLLFLIWRELRRRGS
ncbi:hypothetical protein ACFOZ7_05605 [Natribaculum luteum]|uniref:Uncharacterized protein n=1 Tax=Natribaculum luteum TaxID=1586232 RepID=A0ABD5NWY3_9EURY|nr:hypothetical protein [Natribaculum luteum]